MKLSRLFNSLPKKMAASAIVALAMFFPVASMAAETVHIEGALGVANVTSGETTYKASTNASYDQVVKFQVYYHNTELPDSGKLAQNLRVKIALPTTAGVTQTASTTISADNSNTVTDTATVNLNRADAKIEYMTGSAVWRHNTGTNTSPVWTETKISDSIVTSGTGVVLENEKPCYNYAATVTVLARVKVPGVQVNKQVRLKGTTTWTTNLTAKAGETVQYQITYKNSGNTNQTGVVIRDNMPPKVTYVPGTTYLKNTTNPSGVKYNSDQIAANGIIVGDYTPGGVAYVMFDAKLPAADVLACGDNSFRNVGIAKPAGMNEFFNTADVHITKDCQEQPKPVYSCDSLSLVKGDNRTVTANVTYTAKNGATYKSTSVNWGDGTTNGSTSHQYSKDGTYTVVATVSFTVNGQTVTSSGPCHQTVTFTTTSEKPVYSCDQLSVTQSGRTVTASVAYTAQNGASLKTVTYDWGDSSTPLVTDKTSANYTFAKDGTYTISAKLLFSVNGKDVHAADNQACVKQVSFTTTSCNPSTDKECAPNPCDMDSNAAGCTTPQVLPNTGAGNVIGVFIGVVAASTLGYRLFLSRKLAR